MGRDVVAVQKLVVTVVSLSIALLMMPPAAADPIGVGDFVISQPMVADFRYADGVATVSWFTFNEANSLLGVPAVYNVYRQNFVLGGDQPLGALEMIGSTPHYAENNAYYFQDLTYNPEMGTVYFIRIGFEGGEEGPPSNPTGNYPRCAAVVVGPPPVITLACIIPLPGGTYPPCSPANPTMNPPNLNLHPECLQP